MANAITFLSDIFLRSVHVLQLHIARQYARLLCKYTCMNDARTIHCRSHVLQTPGDLLVPFASWPKKRREKGMGNKREERNRAIRWIEEKGEAARWPAEATNLNGSIFRWLASLKSLYILPWIKGWPILSRLNLFQLDTAVSLEAITSPRLGKVYAVLLGNAKWGKAAFPTLSNCTLFFLPCLHYVRRSKYNNVLPQNAFIHALFTRDNVSPGWFYAS